MPDRTVDHLLIGGGIAVARCAQTLRKEGAEGSILVVTREPDPPYTRPPLSKEYLAGKAGREDAIELAPDWCEENGVELMTRTSVMKLDAGERTAKLSTKEEVGFDKALIATGANVRRLNVDGCDREGIHYLRTFGNSDAIRADAEGAERAVLIGGSFIGCEVAATLTGLGVKCSIVMQEEVTFEPVFGAEVGGFFQRVLEEHGVEVNGGDGLARFEGGDRVGRVVSENGLELDCDLVVIGAGVVPDVMLAKAAGLELGEDGGIRCSDRLETPVAGIYAAGDAAEWDSPLHDGAPVRIEHWDVASEHGKTVARNMLGQDVAHEAVPYFWSDLSDWASLEQVGLGFGERVIRGSLDDGAFTAIALDDGRVVSAVTVGRSEDLMHARRFITERATPDPAAMADLGTDLASL